MYQAHWGLIREPFSDAPAPSPFFIGAAQTEALARLRYLTAGKRRLGLIVGERGGGKTRLLEYFADERRRDIGPTSVVSGAGLTTIELLWQLAADLSLGPRPDDNAARLFRQLADYAASAPIRDRHAVLLLDDAHLAGPDVLTHIVRLLHLGAHANWLTMVLAANVHEAPRLGLALLDAIDMRIEVDPWEESETVGYVQHALFDAGRDEPLFAQDALTSLHALSGGVPRRVNRIAERALILAAVEGTEGVTSQEIAEAADAIGCSA